jgi:hypothetical protein
VLFGDGSVAQLSSRQFEETMQRGYVAANQPATASPGSTIGQAPGEHPAQMLGAAFAAGAGGGVTASSGAAALGQAGGPVAQGIRPIRIDIPRTGQKFTFTKVLNVGDEALTLQALAVASKVLNAVRSVLQVTVFIAGLLLMWWQLRRHSPRSLIVTLALMMILASVGHLLITTRLLGLASPGFRQRFKRDRTDSVTQRFAGNGTGRCRDHADAIARFSECQRRRRNPTRNRHGFHPVRHLHWHRP